MQLMNIKHLITFAFTLGLYACANSPSHLIISPDLHTPKKINYVDKQAQLDVIDMRTANHVVQILQEGEAATLISAQTHLDETIRKTLSSQWQKQGLSISSIATNKITIAIEKAVISVKQQTMKYQSQTEIILKVTVSNGLQTLNSTFKNRGNSKGPLRADIAVLERNFNQRLSDLLTQVLANEKINTFIK
jgi:uncharacterized lipoprotein